MKKNVDMCSGSLADKIIVYTLPIILSNFMQVLYNAADVAVVGKFAGEISVAAVGSTTSLIHLVTNVIIGISVGTAIRTSYYIGAEDERQVEEVTHTSVVASLLLGLLATVVGLLVARPALLMMSTPDDILPQSLLYIRVYFIGLFFTSIYNFGSSILRSFGNTKDPLIFLLVSGAVNVLLNLLLTGVLGMGVLGVAIATDVSQLLSAILVLRKLFTTDEGCRIEWKKLRIVPDKFRQIVAAGLPAGVQTAMFSFANLFMQSAINDCDLFVGANNMLIAGSTASITVEGLVTTAMNSFSTTTVAFTGQNFGARKLDRVDKCFRYILLITLSLSVVLCSVGCLIAPFLIRFSVTDPVAVHYGTIRLRVILAFTFFTCIYDTAISQTRALGDSFRPMLVSIMTICVFRILYLKTAYPYFHSYLCIELIFPISWGLNAVFQTILYCFQRKKVFARVRAEEALAAGKGVNHENEA